MLDGNASRCVITSSSSIMGCGFGFGLGFDLPFGFACVLTGSGSVVQSFSCQYLKFLRDIYLEHL